MNEPIKLNSFPSSTAEALALVYVQNQNLEGKSPKEITSLYYDAYFEIQANISKIRLESKSKIAKT